MKELSVLNELLEKARKFKMSRDEKEEQRRGFAFGNANISNPHITRKDVDREADTLKPKRHS